MSFEGQTYKESDTERRKEKSSWKMAKRKKMFLSIGQHSRFYSGGLSFESVFRNMII